MKIKSIKASFGMSAEIKNVWQKFYFEAEAELEEGDDEEACKEDLWDDVINEVKYQVETSLEED